MDLTSQIGTKIVCPWLAVLIIVGPVAYRMALSANIVPLFLWILVVRFGRIFVCWSTCALCGGVCWFWHFYLSL